jgi:hypothetical protein
MTTPRDPGPEPDTHDEGADQDAEPPKTDGEDPGPHPDPPPGEDGRDA